MTMEDSCQKTKTLLRRFDTLVGRIFPKLQLPIDLPDSVALKKKFVEELCELSKN